jgi:Circularly permutated YpsA SLOG family
MSWNIVIISGGQTGASRAALDFAIENQISYGGWCPKGRPSLDGPIPEKYLLKETPSAEYAERAFWNLRDSDAAVFFSLTDKGTESSRQTLSLAKKLKKPCVHFHQGILAVAEKLAQFVAKHHVHRLAVIGSSETSEPGIYAWVAKVLEKTQKTVASQATFVQYRPRG